MNNVELSLESLKKVLFWDIISEIKAFDFAKYDLIMEKFKIKYFNKEDGFQEYKTNLMKGISNGSIEPPKLEKMEDGTLICTEGLDKLMTYRVLSIKPYVKLVSNQHTELEQNHK